MRPGFLHAERKSFFFFLHVRSEHKVIDMLEHVSHANKDLIIAQKQGEQHIGPSSPCKECRC